MPGLATLAHVLVPEPLVLNSFTKLKKFHICLPHYISLSEQEECLYKIQTTLNYLTKSSLGFLLSCKPLEFAMQIILGLFLHKGWSKLGLTKAEILQRLQGAFLAMGSRLPKKWRRTEREVDKEQQHTTLGEPMPIRDLSRCWSFLATSTNKRISWTLFWKKTMVSSWSMMRNLFLFVLFCFFWGRTLLCSPGWPGTLSPLVSAFRVLR